MMMMMMVWWWWCGGGAYHDRTFFLLGVARACVRARVNAAKVEVQRPSGTSWAPDPATGYCRLSPAEELTGGISSSGCS